MGDALKLLPYNIQKMELNISTKEESDNFMENLG